MRSTSIVLGTSRRRGNTRLLVDAVRSAAPSQLVDLASIDFGFFDYDHNNREDGFLNVVEQLVTCDCIVLATPVYWYAMSAQLKSFVDRFTDLLQIRKDLGRALAGRSLLLIASGTDDALPDGFDVPFRLTANYFGMRWQGAFYGCFNADLSLTAELADSAQAFGRRVIAA